MRSHSRPAIRSGIGVVAMSNRAAIAERYHARPASTARAGSPAIALTSAKVRANGKTTAARSIIANSGSRAAAARADKQRER